MSTRLTGGRFITDAELLLLLPFSTAVRSAHVRNGLSTSPSLDLADAIYADANGITQIPVYTKDGKLVGMVSSADIDHLDESAPPQLNGRSQQKRPIDPSSIDPALTYLSAPKAAQRLGLPERRVTKMLKQDRLHGHQHVAKGNWLVAESEVERWVAEQQQPQ
jgi:Helix-turn-helix domain